MPGVFTPEAGCFATDLNVFAKVDRYHSANEKPTFRTNLCLFGNKPLRVRRPTLYPIELRVLSTNSAGFNAFQQQLNGFLHKSLHLKVQNTWPTRVQLSWGNHIKNFQCFHTLRVSGQKRSKERCGTSELGKIQTLIWFATTNGFTKSMQAEIHAEWA